jgi:amino acid transporter
MQTVATPRDEHRPGAGSSQGAAMDAALPVDVPARSPVWGLDRHRLSPLPVLAQSVAAVAPSGAMATIPAIVVGATGPSALLAFLAAMAVCLLVSSCIRRFACRMRAAGGLYTFTAKAVHPTAALASGWSAIVGYAAVAMAGLVAVGLYLADIAAHWGVAAGPGRVLALMALIVAGLVAWILMHRGIRLSATVTLLVECLSIVLVLTVLGVLLILVLPSARPALAFSPDLDLPALALGTVVALSAFVGFESATTLGVEAHRPMQTVPTALRWTVPGAGVLYLLSVSTQSLALSVPGAPAAGTSLAALVSRYEAGVLPIVLDLAIVTSFFGCTLASVNALARVLFCMGREGVLPARLGRTHRRRRTPSTALAATMPVVIAVPAALVLSGAQAHALRDLLTLSAFGYLGSYLVCCVGVPLFLRRIGELTRGAALVAALAATSLVLVAVYAAVRAFDERPLVVVVFAAAPALAVLSAAVFRWRAPGRLAGVGIYDETSREDLSVGPQRGISG